jgi:subtilisin family serine protease
MRAAWLLAVLITLPLLVPAALPDLGPGSWYAPSKFVVKFHTTAIPTRITQQSGLAKTDQIELDRLGRRFGVSSIEKLFPGSQAGGQASQLAGFFVFHFNGTDQNHLEEVLLQYASLSQIEHVEPVGIHPVTFIPNDPSFGSQWYHDQVNDHDLDSPEAWDVQRGDTLPIIAIIDTGVLWNHPDLALNMWKNWAEVNGQPNVDDDGNGKVDDFRGWDWVNVNTSQVWPGEDPGPPDNDPSDFNGHGTHLAGIAAAVTNNNLGGAGIAGGSYPARGARIMALRAGFSTNDQDTEKAVIDMQYAVSAIYYAADMGAAIINCAWQSSNSWGLDVAMNYAIGTKGVLVTVSAGNNSNQTWSGYLCSRPDVIVVAATDQNDYKTNFSSYGAWVDVSAPGTAIYGTWSSHDPMPPYTPTYAYQSGTSMAAAMVSGLAALLKSHHPAWTRQQLTSQILNASEDINALNPSYWGLLGKGRINANRALTLPPIPDVTVLYPNGGDSICWTIGQTRTITWSSIFSPEYVNIRLNRSYPAGIWETLYENLPNTGSFAWMVTGPPSAASRIRVEASADTLIGDVSNGSFTIGNGTGAPLTLFSDGFNSTFNYNIYSRDDSNPLNGQDYWDNRTTRPYTGSKSCYCAGYGAPTHPPYDNYMDAYFCLKPTCCINLMGYTDATFSFWLWYDTEPDSDYLKLQYDWNGSWVDFPNAR